MFRSSAIQSTTTSSITSTAYCVIGDFNGTSSSLIVNGTTVASGNVGTTTAGPIRLGSNVTTVYTPGDLAEVVVINRGLTAGEIASWQAYTLAKWGV